MNWDKKFKAEYSYARGWLFKQDNFAKEWQPLVKRLHTGPELNLGHGKLVGTQGLVTETITSLTPGQVRLSGEIWTAQPYDETLTIEPGETVEVLQIKGATAYVHPVPRLEP